jgi:hypothetical protein
MSKGCSEFSPRQHRSWARALLGTGRRPIAQAMDIQDMRYLLVAASLLASPAFADGGFTINASVSIENVQGTYDMTSGQWSSPNGWLLTSNGFSTSGDAFKRWSGPITSTYCPGGTEASCVGSFWEQATIDFTRTGDGTWTIAPTSSFTHLPNFGEFGVCGSGPNQPWTVQCSGGMVAVDQIQQVASAPELDPAGLWSALTLLGGVSLLAAGRSAH